MNITIPALDVEQSTALTQLSSAYASPQKWGAAVLLGLIDEQVGKNINAKGVQMLEAAKQLPPAKRLEFTAQAETLLTTIASNP